MQKVRSTLALITFFSALYVFFLATSFMVTLSSCGKSKKYDNKLNDDCPVELTTPADNTVDVSVDASISVSFSRPIDGLSVNKLSFLLVDKEGKTVPGRVAVDGQRAVFLPDSLLDPDSYYKAILTQDIKDENGKPLPFAYTWIFSTEIGTWNGAVQFGSPGEDQAVGIRIGTDRFIYVAGNTTSNIEDNINANAQGTTHDVFVAKLNTRGVRLWVKQLGVPDEDYATAMTLTSRNEVIVVGNTEGDLAPEGASGTGHDFFIAKYNQYGNRDWLRQMGPGRVISTASDQEGNIYIAGYTNGRLETQPIGFSDAFLAQYGPDGSRKWIRQFGTSGNDYAISLIVSGKDIYALGWSSHGMGPSGIVLPIDQKGKKWGLWLALYDAMGTPKWVRHIEEGGVAITDAIADPLGNIYAVGYSARRQGQGRDIYLAKLSKEGEKIWTKRSGVGDEDMATSISLNDEGSILVTGYTHGDFGQKRNNSGREDVFVMAFDPAGERKWTRLYGTPGTDIPMDAVFDPITTEIIIAGHTTGVFQGNQAYGGADVFLLRADSGQTSKAVKPLLPGSSEEELPRIPLRSPLPTLPEHSASSPTVFSDTPDNNSGITLFRTDLTGNANDPTAEETEKNDQY